MSRHHGPHDFTAGEEVTIISGGVNRVNYPGVVDRVTPSQVHVTYDASRTTGRKAIKKVFWAKPATKLAASLEARFSGNGSQKIPLYEPQSA
jgi:hypothetical protein